LQRRRLIRSALGDRYGNNLLERQEKQNRRAAASSRLYGSERCRRRIVRAQPKGILTGGKGILTGGGHGFAASVRSSTLLTEGRRFPRSWQARRSKEITTCR